RRRLRASGTSRCEGRGRRGPAREPRALARLPRRRRAAPGPPRRRLAEARHEPPRGGVRDHRSRTLRRRARGAPQTMSYPRRLAAAARARERLLRRADRRLLTRCTAAPDTRTTARRARGLLATRDATIALTTATRRSRL